MNRISPTTTEIPTTKPTRMSGRITAVTEPNSSPMPASTRPSCTSCTVRTTMPAYHAEATSPRRLATSPPAALSLSSAAIRATGA